MAQLLSLAAIQTDRYVDVPRFEDLNTDLESVRDGDRSPGQIGMSGLEYALGCGMIKVSLQAKNLNHARYLYDMLIPFAPIMIALSAASPIHKGQLSDHDHGFAVFQMATDGRTPTEQDPDS